MDLSLSDSDGETKEEKAESKAQPKNNARAESKGEKSAEDKKPHFPISRTNSLVCDYNNIYASLPNVTRFSWDDLKDVNPIATGHGSSVFSAYLEDKNYENGERPVIAKTARREDLGAKELKHVTREMMRESAFLATVGDKPGIVNLIGHGSVLLSQNEEAYFLVLDKLEGGTLEAFISALAARPSRAFSFGFGGSNNQPSLSLVHLVVLRELAAALNQLHLIDPAYSIIHRDVKPANMGFTKNGTFIIFDLGLAAALPNQASAGVKGVVGSVRYMAPEVALNMRYGRRIDVYSFSIVAYELTHGIKPFKGMGVDAHRELVSKGKIRPDLDAKKLPKPAKKGGDSLGKLIEECWTHEPLSRPPLQTVVNRLDTFINEIAPQGAGASPSAQAHRASIVEQFLPGVGKEGASGAKKNKWSIF